MAYPEISVMNREQVQNIQKSKLLNLSNYRVSVRNGSLTGIVLGNVRK